MFYVVSTRKLLLLHFFTVGVYPLYWFYKNWSLYSKNAGKKMLPVMRAIFSIFFAHSLFALLESKSAERNDSYKWSCTAAATVYVIFTIVGNIADRLAYRAVGEPLTDFIGILVLPVIAWSLYKAQLAANIACNDPDGARNNELNALNYLWLFLGSLLWILIGIGLYDLTVGLPEFD